MLLLLLVGEKKRSVDYDSAPSYTRKAASIH
jgi:hypothetical protein